MKLGLRPRASRGAGVFCLLFLLLPRSAQASGQSRYDVAMSLVEATRFEEAIPKLRILLYPPSLPAAKMKRARAALAQALFHTQQFDAARLELGYLFKSAPGYRIDTRDMAPDCVAFFESVRDSYVAKKRVQAKREEKEQPTPAVAAKPPVTPAPTSAPTTPAPTPAPAPLRATTATAWHPAPWYLAIIPFGGGQFAQHDTVAGAVFLSVEAALLATNIAFAVINSQHVLSDGGFQLGSASEVDYYMQQGTAIALYATLAVGLLDGLLWSPKRMAAVHLTAAPVGANGATLGVFAAF